MGYETYQNEPDYNSAERAKKNVVAKLGHAALFSKNAKI